MIVPGLKSSFMVLSNFLYKIIIKVLVDRLAIITSHKFGFVKGHYINDCIVLASDGVNLLDRKCFGNNVALKVDIRKKN